jgi:hypothetical protein
MMTTDEKRKKLRALRKHLSEAFAISNDLIGEEPSSHTKNGENLYRMRQDVEQCQIRSSFIEYN